MSLASFYHCGCIQYSRIPDGNESYIVTPSDRWTRCPLHHELQQNLLTREKSLLQELNVLRQQLSFSSDLQLDRTETHL